MTRPPIYSSLYRFEVGFFGERVIWWFIVQEVVEGLVVRWYERPIRNQEVAGPNPAQSP